MYLGPTSLSTSSLPLFQHKHFLVHFQTRVCLGIPAPLVDIIIVHPLGGRKREMGRYLGSTPKNGTWEGHRRRLAISHRLSPPLRLRIQSLDHHRDIYTVTQSREWTGCSSVDRSSGFTSFYSPTKTRIMSCRLSREFNRPLPKFLSGSEPLSP